MSLMRLVSLASNGFYGGNDEREQNLNQLLTEMDGFAAAARLFWLQPTAPNP